jgi:hypothetical protein
VRNDSCRPQRAPTVQVNWSSSPRRKDDGANQFAAVQTRGTRPLPRLAAVAIRIVEHSDPRISTDPGLVANNLVALEDDKSLFAAENVVPLIKSAKQNDTVTKTLDAVSAKLTTDDLISMNGEVAKGSDLSDIAKKWLAAAGISKS